MMDGRRMICDFMSFLTVFYSYQDDTKAISKGCAQCNLVNKISLEQDSNPGIVSIMHHKYGDEAICRVKLISKWL